MTAASPTSVLVLGGGPDAERQVSLTSARYVADALENSGRFAAVHRQTIDTLTQSDLRALPGDVIFPVLHGGWGEGGQLQDLLELDGRPYVGSGPRAARAAMDKVATKSHASRIGIPTPAAFILDPRDPVCPLDLPVIVKPVHEGSTIGLYVCNTEADWRAARAAIADEFARGGEGGRRSYMVERAIRGREMTVGLLDNKPLPIIEIRPAEGLYDYEAKYHRSDTQYLLAPDLAPGVAAAMQSYTQGIAESLDIRHVARADFILDADDIPWFLEINTLPGFTDHSLVPKAAAHAGIPMPDLCAKLVDMALRDARAGRS